MSLQRIPYLINAKNATNKVDIPQTNSKSHYYNQPNPKKK